MKPKLLMASPKYISNKIPNNQWMLDLHKENINIDRKKAVEQWNVVKSVLSQSYEINELDLEPEAQDQVYTANIGIVINKQAVISNFYGPGRLAEVFPARQFFIENNFNPLICPFFFEGQADLIKLEDGVYAGAYGMRTCKEALDWFEKVFDIDIIPIKMKEPYLYHLDCLLLSLTEDTIIVAKEAMEAGSIYYELKQDYNIIDVPIEFYLDGVTNSINNRQQRILYTHFDSENEENENRRIEWMEKILLPFDYKVEKFDITELFNSGALLSCCVMNIDE